MSVACPVSVYVPQCASKKYKAIVRQVAVQEDHQLYDVCSVTNEKTTLYFQWTLH
jgi:hypothetical protein